ncbi:Peptidase M56 BlaR1 [Pedobacter cryoconitis]|uniref:Peptidase M56 BlaR1 n=1 Tax=Pedobacter cryoconitis TaxID=188932 RepID=A0A127VEF1_9SPHI|nr:M56 family metallopeptidase [Pedobacter cryoconitis]AMP99722.1 Peptidase M56 BlaR1 [Pedobacter cryoconitis]
MKLGYVDFELNDQIIQAVGNTILHSVWQGAILGVLIGCLAIFGKKLSSNLRYTILVGLLFIAGFVTCVTFIAQLDNSTDESEGLIGYIKEVTPIRENGFETELHYAGANKSIDFSGLILHYFKVYKKNVVLFWFFIVCAKSVQLMMGINSIYHLRKKKIYAVEKYWQGKIKQLCSEMNIKQAVSLFESELAKVPMVIGHFKPFILIPIGLVNALSEDKVEAVLIHELAHIRRNDFLVNILQTLMEVMFFFNPAILWVSALIKVERENCCDDITIKQTNNKINYIQAIVSCKEYQAPVPALSMAFKRNSAELLNRVKRLAGVPDSSLKNIERIILTLCLLSTLLVTMAFSVKTSINTEDSHQLFISKSSPLAYRGNNVERVSAKELIAELMHRGLIKNKNNFKVRLTNEGLFIDGIKQSKTLHKRVMQMYVKDPNRKLSFTKSVSID